jgi:hypothetical protein
MAKASSFSKPLLAREAALRMGHAYAIPVDPWK